MADQDIEAYLRSLKTSDRVRAAAWDAIYTVPDDAQAQTVLQQLTLPDAAKAAIWDARSRVKATSANETPAAPEGSAVGRFLGGAAEMLNPVTAVRGLAHAVANPIDTAGAIYNAHADQFGKAKEAFGQGRYSEAAGHGMAGVVPIIGPAAANVGEQIGAGDVAGGLGAATGLLTGAAVAGPVARGVGNVARPVAQATGRRLYQSVLKPTKANLNDVRPAVGMTPQETLLQTGLNEGIPVTARGAKKVETLIDSLDAEVRARVAKISASGEKVDPALVEQAIDDVVRDFTNQVNAQPDLSAIGIVRENFRNNPNVAQPVAPAQPANFAAGQVSGTPAKTRPGPIDPVVAQQMKSNTYKGLRGKYDKERGATIEAEKAGARGLREGIEQAGARAGVDDLAAVNAREGSLISLEHALSDALRRRGNYNVLGLKGAIGGTASIATESTLPLLAMLVDRFPGLISRSGIWINRAGTTGRGAAGAGRATVAGTTSPSESQNRTTGRGRLEPYPAP
jgi:hypothetical protein